MAMYAVVTVGYDENVHKTRMSIHRVEAESEADATEKLSYGGRIRSISRVRPDV